MSWTDIFPVLDDAMLDAYRQGVSDEERKQFEDWFGVAEVVGHASRVSGRTGVSPVLLDATAAETATVPDRRDACPPNQPDRKKSKNSPFTRTKILFAFCERSFTICEQ